MREQYSQVVHFPGNAFLIGEAISCKSIADAETFNKTVGSRGKFYVEFYWSFTGIVEAVQLHFVGDDFFTGREPQLRFSKINTKHAIHCNEGFIKRGMVVHTIAPAFLQLHLQEDMSAASFCRRMEHS